MRGDSAVPGFKYDGFVFVKAAVTRMDWLCRSLAQDPNRAQIATKAGLIALASVGWPRSTRAIPCKNGGLITVSWRGSYAILRNTTPKHA